MRILFVNQYYWPDLAATAQQMSDLAEHLAARGHDVTVLCSRGQYADGSGTRTPRRQVHEGVHIRRLSAPGFGKSGRFGRVIDYAGFHLLTGLWMLLFGWRHRVIVTLTTPPLIGLYATLAKWLTLGRTRHVCWVMDLHPDIEFELGMWSRRHPLYATFGFLNDLHLRKANAVVALGPCMAERLRRKGIAGDRVQTISVWNRAGEVEPMAPDASTLRNDNGLSDRFVVMYSGNAGIIHHFDAVCEAMRRLDGDERVRFLFVGSGRRLAEIRGYVDEHQLGNFICLPYQPREMLGQSLAAGDVHLVTMRPRMQGTAVPCKTYGIMAAGRPVIFVGPADADTAVQVREADMGFVLDVDDADGLVAAIRKLADDPALVRRLGDNARSRFLEHFEKDVCCRRWADLLEGHSADHRGGCHAPGRVGAEPDAAAVAATQASP